MRKRPRPLAALIVPHTEDPLDDLVDRGQARPPRVTGGFSEIRRVRSDMTSTEIIDDLRTPW